MELEKSVYSKVTESAGHWASVTVRVMVSGEDAIKVSAPTAEVRVVDDANSQLNPFEAAKAAAISGLFYGRSLARSHLGSVPTLEFTIEELAGTVLRTEFEAFAIAASHSVAFALTQEHLLRENDWGKWKLMPREISEKQTSSKEIAP